jgi:uncharacterized protein
MIDQKLIASIRSEQAQLHADGVKHIAIFGSRARGDARADSDMDVLIDVQEGKRFSLLSLSGVALLIEDATGVPTQVVMRRSAPADFLARITGDLVPVF